MTDTNTQVDANQPDNRGLPPGVTADNTDGTQRGEGAPKAPEINNAPPKVEPTAEEKQAKADADAQIQKDTEAQAAKEAEAAKAKEEEGKAPDAEPSDYEDYGDETANAVAVMLKDSGVDIKTADGFFREAFETGDLSKINQAELIAKVGKEKANLIMIGVKDYYNRTTAATKETVSSIYTELGGEANWVKVRDWARGQAAKDTAFAAKMAGYNQMFDLNGTAAALAAKELRGLYEAAAGNSSLQKTQVQGDSASTSIGSNFEALGRDEYLTQVKAAHAKGDWAEVSRLEAQRKATRNTR